MGLMKPNTKSKNTSVSEPTTAITVENTVSGLLRSSFAKRKSVVSMPNVIVTSHQAFLTEEALTNIAETTVLNMKQLHDTGACANELIWKDGEIVHGTV